MPEYAEHLINDPREIKHKKSFRPLTMPPRTIDSRTFEDLRLAIKQIVYALPKIMSEDGSFGRVTGGINDIVAVLEEARP